MSENKDEQVRYYDEWFEDFSYANLLQLERAVSILDGLLSTECSRPRILDFGCGPGWFSNILANFGPTLGVDLSRETISRAKVRYQGPEYQSVDIFNWDYPTGAFDIVVSQEVLEHVEDQTRYLDIAYELLRKGGYLILTTPNAKTMLAIPEKQRKEWTNQPLENWVTRRELRALLRRRFNKIHMNTITFGMGSKGSYRLVNSSKLESILQTIGLLKVHNLLRARMGYGLHIVAVAQKP
jgi:2-polyprenyl-3-methyl-5-hydroxy-6-metoxy-1,4-benzoquinol methylase